MPEGSYATDPTDPKARIREFKEMVQAFHVAGNGVILDVVYNLRLRLLIPIQHIDPNSYHTIVRRMGPFKWSGVGNELKPGATHVTVPSAESLRLLAAGVPRRWLPLRSDGARPALFPSHGRS